MSSLSVCQSRHVQIEATPARPHGRKTVRVRHLQPAIHAEQQPQGVYVYECDICNLQFTQSNSLKVCVCVYECDICNLRFTQSNSLEVCVYECDICNLRFTQSNSLKVCVHYALPLLPFLLNISIFQYFFCFFGVLCARLSARHTHTPV